MSKLKCLIDSNENINIPKKLSHEVKLYISDRSCSTCTHAVHTDVITSSLDWLDDPVICRRYPPTFIGIGRTASRDLSDSLISTTLSDWSSPVVDGSDSCGEYKQNEKIKGV